MIEFISKSIPSYSLPEGVPNQKGTYHYEEGGGPGDPTADKHRVKGNRPIVPAFYAHSHKVLSEKMPNRMNADEMHNLLDKNGVTEDEKHWHGINDFAPKGSGKTVDKKEILDHINNHTLHLDEIEKNNSKPRLEHIEKQLEELGYGVHPDDIDATPTLEDLRNGHEYTFQMEDRIPEEARDLFREYHNLTEIDDNGKNNISTKFEKHTLPGGENYKEILLTIPQTEESLQAATEGWTAKKGGGDPASGPIWEVRDSSGHWISGIPLEYASTPERAIRRALEKSDRGKERNPAYKSSHWSPTPNVLMHIRTDERTDTDGNKMLFIEEIQSDWHQDGRKKGYNQPSSQPQSEKDLLAGKLPDGWKSVEVDQSGMASSHNFKIYDSEGNEKFGVDKLTPEELVRHGEIERNVRVGTHSNVPDAPLKKTEQWAGYAMRRMIREAAEKGFDKIGWTTGDQQAERYDLSHHVDWVYWNGSSLQAGKGDMGDYRTENLINQDGVDEKNLSDYVGKEVAEKLIEKKANSKGAVNLSGVDLKIGGEGMKGFYDKILPSIAAKIGKKYGAKIESSQIVIEKGHEFKLSKNPEEYAPYPWAASPTGYRGSSATFKTQEEAQEYIDKMGADKTESVHSMSITPELKDTVLHEGQPLFKSFSKDNKPVFTLRLKM